MSVGLWTQEPGISWAQLFLPCHLPLQGSNG
jgi:hypothetical protein